VIDRLALNGGGRYDGLAENLGGGPTAGIGFGAGVERIIAELKKQGITPPPEERPRAFVVYFGKTTELKEAAVQLVAELRRAGIKTEINYGDRSPKAQMKQANSSGADDALLIVDNELRSGVVALKNLQATGMELEQKQIDVPRAQILAYLESAG
jgi:histidyl-tRNA synthetase